MLIQAGKMAVIGQLSSGVAHEVKNPLSVILNGISFLEQELKLENADQIEVFQLMKDAVHRSDRIIRGLLDFSKPSSCEPKPCNLGEIVDASLHLVKKQFAVKEIQIQVDVPASLPPVLVDDNQMKQVFINLMLNALQAMPSGGRLLVRAAIKELTTTSSQVGRRSTDTFKPGERVLVCDVEDTGAGIPKDLLTKVFEPFFTTKPAGQGVGLGLAITKAIVERQRGLIELRSQEGQGTTVSIVLPLAMAGKEEDCADASRQG